MPKVSVILPVFNCEKYVFEAIQSILNQSFKDFEFIIINDGSTDNSLEIVKLAAESDNRIIFINNEKNLGLIKTLNIGLNLASGEYIIRMDGDDVSKYDRIEKQIKFLDINKEIGLLGSYYECFGDTNVLQKKHSTHKDIKIASLFSSPFAHPTICLRASVLKENNLIYNETALHVEDYDLWSKLLDVTKGANYPEVLLRYRVHNAQITSDSNETQKLGHQAIQFNQLKKLNIEISNIEFEKWLQIINYRPFSNVSDRIVAFNFLTKLQMANISTMVFDKTQFEYTLSNLAKRLCYFPGVKGSNFSFFRLALNSNLFQIKYQDVFLFLKFYFKSVIN